MQYRRNVDDDDDDVDDKDELKAIDVRVWC